MDYVTKPGGTISVSIDQIMNEMISKVRAAARATPRRKPATAAGALVRRIQDERRKLAQAHEAQARSFNAGNGLLLLGASTGGPRALEIVLSGLPARFPWPVVVAQHMPAGFTKAFAERLDQLCALEVREASTTMPVEPGIIFIARGGADLLFANRAGRLHVVPTPENANHLWHPSVELLGRSALQHCDPRHLTAVLLTGMGYDGSDSFADIKLRGGRTIAESEDSAVVYGMPAELVRKGGASLVLTLEKISSQLAVWAGRV